MNNTPRQDSPSEQFTQAVPTTRRGFLKFGLMGSAALAIAGTTATLSGCSQQPDSTSGYKILRAQDREFLAALIPAIVGSAYPGALNAQAKNRTIRQLDNLIYTLHEFNRTQMMQLFDALSIAPVRFAMGGPWVRWQEASTQQVNDFLTSWRDSSIQLKRMGYVSLAKLVGICWYAQPENFASIGYPGPPTKIPLEPVRREADV